MNSRNRTALVTGASSGIGTEIARELARRGYGVTLVARREDRLRELADELEATGVRAEVLATDLVDPASRAQLPQRVADLGLEVSILVNNAGFSTTGPVSESDVSAELRMIELNVAAVADLCSRFLPAMVERGGGAVLNVASTAAFQPLPYQSGYGASKAFVLSYTHALRGELRGTGVTATTLCPGPVKTEFAEAAGLGETENSTPDFLWETADAVARAGVRGMLEGRAKVIPGPINRITATLGNIAPRSILVPVIARSHPAKPKDT